MKKFILKIVLVSLCVPVALSMADDFEAAREQVFSVETPDAYAKFEEMSHMPTAILKKFNPVGLSVQNKVVENGKIELDASKMGFQLRMVGVLNIERASEGCSGDEKAFIGKMDFTRSGARLSNNITSLELTMCVTEKSSDSLLVRVNGKIHKSPHYGGFIASIVMSTIKDQITPVIEAIKSVVLAN